MNKAIYVVFPLAFTLIFMGCPDKGSSGGGGGFTTNDGGGDPDTVEDADTTPTPEDDADATTADDGDGAGPVVDADAGEPDTQPDADEEIVEDPDTEIVEGGCEDDDECSDLSDGCCTVGACVDGTCVAQELEDCCSGSNDECDNGDAQTTDVCGEACVAGGCIHSQELCPGAPLYISKNFDDASMQFLQAMDGSDDGNVGISLSKAKSVSPSWSIYLGDADCNHYYNGDVDESCNPVDPNAQASHDEELSIVTPTQITLAEEGPSFLSFWVNMSAEPFEAILDVNGDPVPGIEPFDYLAVYVEADAEYTRIYRSTDEGALGEDNHTDGEWVFQTVDLTPWAGQDIDVIFAFRFGGGNDYNAQAGDDPWYGVYLDDITVQGSCEDAACEPGIDDACSADISSCTDNVCTAYFEGETGVCAYQTAMPGTLCLPCNIPENCSDDACYVYECNNGMCENLDVQCCAESSTFPTLTAPPDVAYEGFEDGDIVDWPIEDMYEDDNVSWQIDTSAAFNGMYSLYFGDPDTQTYAADPPNPAAATAWTPFFEVDTDLNREQVTSFWLWMSTEFDGMANPADDPISEFTDVLEVQIQRYGENGVALGWTSADIGNTTGGDWLQVGIDLTSYRGETIRLGFAFDSGEATANDYGGVRIDDLTVASACATDCLSGWECPDGDQCTADWCELGECVNGEPEPGCCESDTDCNDDNDCTLDTCVGGQCDVQYDLDHINTCCSEGNWPGETVASFEDGEDGYAIETQSDPVTWHVASGKASSGENAMTFSDPETNTYDSGGVSIGRMVSPPIQVPPTPIGNPYASFAYYMDTEWNDNASVDFFPEIVQDELRVRVASDKNGNDILDQDDIEEADIEWVSHYTLNTTDGKWLDTRVDLDGYRGETIQLVFEFDSGDDQKNGYAGPFIDDVSYGATCNEVQCIFAGQCTPPDDCKLPVCNEAFTCEYVQKNTPECCEPSEDDDLGDSFEDDDSSWTFDSCQPAGADSVDDASMWQVTDGAAGLTAKDGAQLLYFGNGENYGGDGSGSCGVATGGPVALDAGIPWTVEFWLYLDIESHSTCADGGLPTSDSFHFRVIDTVTDLELMDWTKESIQCSDYGKWAKRAFDLSDHAGKTVRLEFSFDTYDGIANEGKGIAIDDIVFVRGCAEL